MSVTSENHLATKRSMRTASRKKETLKRHYQHLNIRALYFPGHSSLTSFRLVCRCASFLTAVCISFPLMLRAALRIYIFRRHLHCAAVKVCVKQKASSNHTIQGRTYKTRDGKHLLGSSVPRFGLRCCGSFKAADIATVYK